MYYCWQDKLHDGTFTLERTRAWVRGAGRQLVRERRAVQLDELLDGRAQAFIAVHSDAMLALVADAPRGVLPAEGAPETLQMDLVRLNGLRREFDDIATRMAMLAVMRHGIGGGGRSSAAAVGPFEAVATLIAEEDPFQSVSDISTMLARVQAVLNGRAAELSSSANGGGAEVAESLMRQLRQASTAGDCVNALMVRRLRGMIERIMRHGSLAAANDAGGARVLQIVEPLMWRIQSLATRLMALSNLNRTVHLPTYNQVIGDLARELRDEDIDNNSSGGA